MRRRGWGLLAIFGGATAGAATIPDSEAAYTSTRSNAGNALATGSVSVPTSFACEWTGSNQITLTWADASPTVTSGYTFERSNTSGSGFSTLGTTSPATATSGIDSNPAPTTLRYYRVKATRSNWSSAFTGEVVSNQCVGTITSLYTAGSVSSPFGVAVDASGNVYTSSNGEVRVKKTTPGGTTTTVAGNGATGYTGDGGPATSATFNNILGIAIDPSGNLYIADAGNNVVRKVTPGGTISTWAGTGIQGDSGDGGPATSAELDWPVTVAFDSAGNGYIADANNHRIRKVTPGGTITTVAGDGTAGNSGNGGAATSARLDGPFGVAVASNGDIYIADSGNHVLRKVSGGIITQIAGGGGTSTCSFSGSAGSVSFNNLRRLAIGSSGELYITDQGNHCVRVLTGSTISQVTGSGGGAYTGDNGPAEGASVNMPSGLAISTSGDLFIADAANNVVRKIRGIAA